MARLAFLLMLSSGLMNVVHSATYNVDNLNEVDLEVDGDVYLQLTSNPSTGYAWFLTPPNSPYIEVRGMLTGEYSKKSDHFLGAPVTQTFHLGCTSLCVPGVQTGVLLTYARPWEKFPLIVQKVLVNIVPSNTN